MRLRVPDGLMPVAHGEFIGVEARDVAHREQSRIIGIELAPRQREDPCAATPVAGSMPPGPSEASAGPSISAQSAALLAQELLRLLDRHRHEPGPQLGSGLGPCRASSHAMSQAACTASSAMAGHRRWRGDTAHVLVMVGDDPRKACSSPARADAMRSPPSCRASRVIPSTPHIGLWRGYCLRRAQPFQARA